MAQMKIPLRIFYSPFEKSGLEFRILWAVYGLRSRQTNSPRLLVINPQILEARKVLLIFVERHAVDALNVVLLRSQYSRT